jgi:UDP-N-acetylmuramate--alanine ligase
MFPSIKRIHFIGIGGIGMSGIAEILINKGFQISGSDCNPSENTEHLEKLGANIFYEHTKNNIDGAEVVVYSSAVDINTNPEIIEANIRKIPVIRRAEMLAEISRLNYCIAVSGTHGKTTVTSMLALILIKANIDPTVVVGGRLKDLGGTNARLGNGNWTIVEADEYDRSFLQLTPSIAVINNLEADHMDIYEDFVDLKTTFAKFANMTPFYGFIAVGIDCEGVDELLPELRRKVIKYGLSDKSDYQAKNISYEGFSSTCDVYEYGKFLGKMTISVPGEFNIKNALSAVSIARQFDIDFDLISTVISKFNGAFRRFEIKGTKNNITVIDDYAHHPTEVKATLFGAKKSKKRVIAIFQPHTFTRTKEFYNDFAESFIDADIVFVTDIYPARERPIVGVTGELIVSAAQKKGFNNVNYLPFDDNLCSTIKQILEPGDVVITLGAGDIWKVANKLYDVL